MIIVLGLLFIGSGSYADDFYWIGGSGNWSDIMHWSDQPGGRPTLNPPTFEDNVFFDEFSFTAPNQTVTVNTIASCRDMDWSGVTNMPVFKDDGDDKNDLTIYGSLKFSPNMVLDYGRPIYFRTSTPGNVISFAGQSLQGDVIFKGNGGWVIIDVLDASNHIVQFDMGQLDFQGDIRCDRFISDSGRLRKLSLNSSVLSLQGASNTVLNINSDNLIFEAGTSSIEVQGNGVTFETTGGSTLSYNDVSFQGNGVNLFSENPQIFHDVVFVGDAIIQGGATYNNLTFSPGMNYSLSSGDTQVVDGTFNAVGNCGQYISIKGNEGVAVIDAALVNLTNLKVEYVRASGAASHFLAIESFDLGNCINWNIQNPVARNYIWTGASGDNLWSNRGNWDQNCVPTRIDNVTIDGAPFRVEIDKPCECKNLTLAGGAVLDGASKVSVFGSLTANTGTWGVTGETYFWGDGVHDIDVGGNIFLGDVIFSGNGSWDLRSDLLARDHVINFLSGTLNTNSHKILVKAFHSGGINPRVLNLDASEFVLEGAESDTWEISGKSLVVNAGSSSISFDGVGAGMVNQMEGNISYYNVIFSSTQEWVRLDNKGSGVSFFDLSIASNGVIEGDHVFSTLHLSEGDEYLFAPGSIQEILDGLDAHGSCKDFIIMRSEGGQATIKSEKDIILDNVKMENMIALGSKRYEVNGGIDLGGNKVWVLKEPLPQDLHWTGFASDANWFNADNWTPKCIPTRVDNVFFDDVNFTSVHKEVNIPDGGPVAECSGMSWANAPNDAFFTGAGKLDVFGSLNFNGLNDLQYSGDITFKSIKNESILMGGNELNGKVHFEGDETLDDAGNKGEWVFEDAFSSVSDIVIERGVVDFNSQDIHAKAILSSFSSQRSLLMQSSDVYLDGLEFSPENMIMEASSSVLHFNVDGQMKIASGKVPIFFNKVLFEDENGLAILSSRADDVTINDLTFDCNSNLLYGGLTIGSMTLAKGKTYRFQEEVDYNIGDINAVGGCEGFIDLATFSAGVAANFISKDGAVITIEGANLMDIHASGTDLFVANNSIDLGNNDGWKFKEKTDGRNLFWVNDQGDWDDINHWSTTSGGPGGACLPTALDNVIFDENSFTKENQTVNASSNDIRCKSMDWRGAKHTPRFASPDDMISGIYIFGSLYFIKDMEWDFPAMMNFYFRSNEKNQVIETGGFVFPNDVWFDGAREDKLGGWTLFDDLRMDGDLILDNGDLIVNGNEVECMRFLSENSSSINRILDLSNSVLVINAYNGEAMKVYDFNDVTMTANFDLLASASTIKVVNEGEIAVTGLLTGAMDFGNVVFQDKGKVNASRLKLGFDYLTFKADGEIIGKNHFGVLELLKGNTYKFGQGKIYEISREFLAQGTCNDIINIESDEEGLEATISKTSGDINLDYIFMKDIHAKNNGGSYVATNSVDLGNTDGWIITELESKTLYWVGNGITDEWSDYENWSTTSGGSAEGCVPNPIDDVVFDGNSFFGSKDVNVVANAYCHNMTWTAEVDPSSVFNVDAQMQVAGSLVFTANMSANVSSPILFVGDNTGTVKQINFVGKTLNGDIVFEGANQIWSLLDGFLTTKNLLLNKGTLNTQGQDFGANRLESENFDSSDVRLLNLGSSTVEISAPSEGLNLNFFNSFGEQTLNVNTEEGCLLKFMHGGDMICKGYKGNTIPVTFGDLYFFDDGNLVMTDVEGIFNNVSFIQEGHIKGVNTFSSLTFTLGFHNTIEAGEIITIGKELNMNGVTCEPVELKSDMDGETAFVQKADGIVEVTHIRLRDIHATGGAAFNVYGKLEPESNVAGWTDMALDDDNDEGAYWGFKRKPEVYCDNVAHLGVSEFPQNKNTTYQWYKYNDPVYEVVGEGSSYDVIEDGKYKVKISFNAHCELEDFTTVVFDSDPKIQLQMVPSNARCAGEINGEILANVKDGYEPYTFSWTDEAGTDLKNDLNPHLQGLAPGKYFLTVSDNHGCDVSEKVEIFDAYPLELTSVIPTDNTCFGDNNGSLAITAEGGTGDYMFFVNNQIQGGTVDNLASGNYNVYVKDGNDCISNSEDVTIDQPTQITFDWLTDGLHCNGDRDGILNPQATGGTGNLNYYWTLPDGSTSDKPQLTGLSGGEYKLQVSDEHFCVEEEPYFLVEPDPLQVSPQIVKQVSCFGENSGEVYIQASNGKGDFTYQLGKLENKDGIFKNMTAGFYPVKVIDDGGCQETSSVELKEPVLLELRLEDRVDPVCTGNASGVLAVNAAGGNGDYVYSWTGPNDFRSTNNQISGLGAGNYHLILKDRNNCLVEKDYNLDEPNSLEMGLRVKNQVSATGASDGVLVVEMVGGTTPYMFTCEGPDGFVYHSPIGLNDKSHEISGLSGGIYRVNINDASGCFSIVKKVMVEEPGKLLAFISHVSPIRCNGGNDGALSVSMSGGDGNYQIKWDGPSGLVSDVNMLNNLSAGSYKVTVTSRGASVSDVGEILEPAPLTASIVDHQDVSCYGETSGSLKLEVVGGTPKYDIFWQGDNGFLSQANQLIQLEAGDYTYSVTDANGCKVTDVTQVLEANILSCTVVTQPVSASGLKDGGMQIDVNGGSPEYHIHITGPENYTQNLEMTVSGSLPLRNLKQGTYHIQVTDAHGCVMNKEANVVEPGQLLAWVESKTDLKCYGDGNGTIDLKVDGGSGKYEYQWSGANYYKSQVEDPSGIGAGVYHVVVIDTETNEVVRLETEIFQPDPVDAEFSVQNISCNGYNDGYVNIYPKGGTPYYSFSWTGNVDNILLEDQANLQAGDYSVVITDKYGCKSQPLSFTITEPEPISVSEIIKTPSCYGDENGEIQLIPVNGTAPYVFHWEGVGSILNELTSLQAGDYSYSMYDKNGCKLTDVSGSVVNSKMVTLTQPGELSVEIGDADNILCAGDGNGRALANVKGGTAEYNYLWSDGQSNAEAVNLGKGDYTVDVTDANNCMATAKVSIDEPEPMKVHVEMIRPVTQGSEDGEIRLKVNGGVPNYSYSWDPDLWIDDEITGLSAGKYRARVMDFNSCILDTTITLNNIYDNRVAIPKAFTPNGDGFNDIWNIERVEFVDRLQIAVYDRWGKTVYKYEGSGSEYRGTPWAGQDRSKDLPIGSYYYAIVLDDDKPIIGYVTIVR